MLLGVTDIYKRIQSPYHCSPVYWILNGACLLNFNSLTEASNGKPSSLRFHEESGGQQNCQDYSPNKI